MITADYFLLFLYSGVPVGCEFQRSLITEIFQTKN